MGEEALALSTDALNKLPQYRGDYVDVDALRRAVRALEEPHLRGGKASFRATVNRQVRPALRAAVSRSGSGSGRLGEYQALIGGGSKPQPAPGSAGPAGGTAQGSTLGEQPGGSGISPIRPGSHDVESGSTYGTTASTGTRGDDEGDDPPDIRMFCERFTYESVRVDRAYEGELERLESRFDKLVTFCNKIVAARGKRGIELKRDELVPEYELLYRGCHHLENFALTNFSICTNILAMRKVDGRRWGNGWLGERLAEELNERRFARARGVRELMDRIRASFAQSYCDHNVDMAEYRLLRKQRDHIDWHTVVVGAWIGAALMGALWAFYTLVDEPAQEGDAHDGDLAEPVADKTGGKRIFRATGLVLFMFWGFCLQVGIWREMRINIPVIFGIPAALFPTTPSLFLHAARTTVLYLVCMVMYVQDDSSQANVYPMIVLGGFAALLVLSWYRVVYAPRRSWARQVNQSWFSTVRETAWGAFVFVTGTSERFFFTAYLTDYLTSSTKILADLAHVGCNLVVRDHQDEPFTARFRADSKYCVESWEMNFVVIPVVMCWPLWLRLAQNLSRLYATGNNFPFLANAAKYALAHTVTIFSALHPELLNFDSGSGFDITVFVFVFVVTTFVTFAWDVLVDWGLGDTHFGGLRAQLMLAPAHPSLYYAAIVADFFMRNLWTVQLVPQFQSTHTVLLSTAGTTALEVVRRTFWGLIRVENEMLHNTRNYEYPTKDGEFGHFIPLYFDSPFQKEMEREAMREEGFVGDPEARQAARVKAEIVAFLAVVLGLASFALVYRPAD